jgi:NifU-like protein involved in Fe-S cluster formation
MEMETEDDVIVEGNTDASSTAAANLMAPEIQGASITNAEMATTWNEELRLHSGTVPL